MCRYWLGTKIFIWIHSSARKSALLRFKDSHSNCIHKFKIFLQLTYSFQVFPRPIQLSHWHQHGAKSWISCKWLKALRKASQWQLIKCSAPSTICWHQCDIQVLKCSVSIPACYLACPKSLVSSRNRNFESCKEQELHYSLLDYSYLI